MSGAHVHHFQRYTLLRTRAKPHALRLLDARGEPVPIIWYKESAEWGIFVTPRHATGLHFFWDEVRHVEELPEI